MVTGRVARDERITASAVVSTLLFSPLILPKLCCGLSVHNSPRDLCFFLVLITLHQLRLHNVDRTISDLSIALLEIYLERLFAHRVAMLVHSKLWKGRSFYFKILLTCGDFTLFIQAVFGPLTALRLGTANYGLIRLQRSHRSEGPYTFVVTRVHPKSPLRLSGWMVRNSRSSGC